MTEPAQDNYKILHKAFGITTADQLEAGPHTRTDDADMLPSEVSTDGVHSISITNYGDKTDELFVSVVATTERIAIDTWHRVVKSIPEISAGWWT